MRMVDRGSFWRIRNTAFQVFCAIEEELCSLLSALLSEVGQSQKTKTVTKLASSKNVQFYWCIAAADFDNGCKSVHDEQIIEVYISVGGFA